MQIEDLVKKILSRPREVAYMEVLQSAFKCQRCGSCCTQMNGISVTDKDISRLAKCFGHGPRWFKNNYTEINVTKKEIFLKGTDSDEAKGKCPFYNESIGCTVYKARPLVCRIFPLLNLMKGKIEPHLYKDCPGTVALVEEIKEYKEKYFNPQKSLDEKQVSQLLIISHINMVKDLKWFFDRKQYSELIRITPTWDQVNRSFVIDFLSRIMSQKDIDEFLSLVEKNK